MGNKRIHRLVPQLIDCKNMEKISDRPPLHSQQLLNLESHHEYAYSRKMLCTSVSIHGQNVYVVPREGLHIEF